MEFLFIDFISLINFYFKKSIIIDISMEDDD